MSLTKKAESTPHVRIRAGSSIPGFSRRKISSAFHSKNPASFNHDHSIMANSKTIVLKSTARIACSPGTILKTTMAVAPMIAGRCDQSETRKFDQGKNEIS